MNSWNVNDLELKAHAPQILSSTKDARAIALAIPAGESLQDHQVHERAWVSIVSGEAEIPANATRFVPSQTSPAAAADAVAGRRAPRTNVAPG